MSKHNTSHKSTVPRLVAQPPSQGAPKMLEELYEEFRKFSRAEVFHFRKLDQQRKAANENESSRPFKYSKGKEGAPTFDATYKQVHSIDSDGCRPPENWEKKFSHPRQESDN
jgi:hypothetical protein